MAVFASADALLHAAAERFVCRAVEATRVSGRFSVALAGGSTPEGLYRLLATDAYARRIDWARAQVYWGDERCVSMGMSGTNYRMACEQLLDRVPVPAQSVHRIRCGQGDPARSAAAYESELRAAFATPDGPPRTVAGRRFDLVLLGMGADGHTASLFPGMDAVRERERWVRAQHVAAVSMWRITLTPVVINAAAEVVFLVAGREKAPSLRRVLEGPFQPDALPAQAIAPLAGRIDWFIDVAASAELRRPV